MISKADEFKRTLFFGIGDNNIYSITPSFNKKLIYKDFKFHFHENGPFNLLNVSEVRGGKYLLLEIPLDPEDSLDYIKIKHFIFDAKTFVLLHEFDGNTMKFLSDDIVAIKSEDEDYITGIYICDKNFELQKILEIKGFPFYQIELYHKDVNLKEKRFYEVLKGEDPLRNLLFSLNIDTKKVNILNNMFIEHITLF